MTTQPGTAERPDGSRAEDERAARLWLVLRQACYFMADAISREYGLERRIDRDPHRTRTVAASGASRSD